MTGQRLTVLAIGYVWPEPNSSAAGTYMLSLLKACLAQGWQVTFASAAAPSIHMVDIEALGINKVSIELNNASFDQFIGQLMPDIVIFDRFMIEEQFGWRVEKHCPAALRILDTEDLHFLRHARHLAYKQNRPISPSDLHSDMAKREVAAILRSDLSLIISCVEYQLLQQSFAVAPALLLNLPFMLNLHSEPLPSYADRQHFISIGNFRHAPNWDSVLWLKESIWPLIRQQLPQAQLHIYGAYPPPKATALHQPKQGFHVLGWTNNANTVMQQARVCLAPLRFGAGIKGKLAEAMLNGTPNVTTGVGAEAMAANLPWSGLMAETAQDIADQAVRLYQDQSLWSQYQSNGFTIIEQLYNAQLLGQRLVDRIHQQRQQLAQLRDDNFTGAMLRHHCHKSTQYMAQWIEAKNKIQPVSD